MIFSDPRQNILVAAAALGTPYGVLGGMLAGRRVDVGTAMECAALVTVVAGAVLTIGIELFAAHGGYFFDEARLMAIFCVVMHGLSLPSAVATAAVTNLLIGEGEPDAPV